MWERSEDELWRAKGWEPDGQLWGRGLRQALVLLLSTTWRPCAIDELVAALEDLDYRPRSRPAHKAVADALRYEVERGRVTRVARGTYACRPLPYSTRRRYDHYLRTRGLMPRYDVRKLRRALDPLLGAATPWR